MSGSSSYQNSGLFEILPQARFNAPLQELFEGGTSKGIMGIIFPNGEAMFNWFKGFSEKSLGKLGVFNLLKIKSPGSILGSGNIPSPIGLPQIPGVTSGGKGK